jgi:TolB protein
LIGESHTLNDTTASEELYVMNADGRGRTRLTANADWDGMPAWSPDGRLIAFVSEREGTRHIFVMGSDGSDQSNITPPTNSDALEESPAWWGPPPRRPTR